MGETILIRTRSFASPIGTRRAASFYSRMKTRWSWGLGQIITRIRGRFLIMSLVLRSSQSSWSSVRYVSFLWFCCTGVLCSFIDDTRETLLGARSLPRQNSLCDWHVPAQRGPGNACEYSFFHVYMIAIDSWFKHCYQISTRQTTFHNFVNSIDGVGKTSLQICKCKYAAWPAKKQREFVIYYMYRICS